VAAYLDMEFSTLARYERCEWPLPPNLVTALLNMYGVDDEAVRSELLDLERDSACLNGWRLDPPPPAPSAAARAGVTQSYLPVGQTRTAAPPPLAWLYGQASEVAVYAAGTVPDLLRTRAYALAAAVHTADPATTAPPRIQYKIETLTQRQKQIVDAMVPIVAVIDEHVLHRPIGGRAVLAAQLDHLRDLTTREDCPVAVQILPTDVDFHPSGNGGFTVLRLGYGFPPVALVEHLGGHMLLEGPWAARYATMFGRLTEVALTPTASHTALTDRAKELANQPAPPPKGDQQ